jgi:hypothetical protein
VAGLPMMRLMRKRLQRLGPYQSLAVLGLPALIVEPAKLAAVVVFGAGHWLSGTVVLCVAYALSFCLIERLFRIVKPKLLTLRWFAKMWCWFIGVRAKAMALFTKP